MKEQVFFGSDARGLTMLSVAVFSLLQHANNEEEITLLIAHDDSFITVGGEAKLHNIIAKFPFAKAIFRNFEPMFRQHEDEINADGLRWPPMMWARVFISELFPEIEGDVLYLDIDTLVQQDLTELYNLDLSKDNYIFAAVPEMPIARRLELSNITLPNSGKFYFNSGVLVIDATAYKREHIGEALVKWYHENNKTAKFPDQDAINAVTGNRILALPPKWNYDDNLLRRVRSIDTKATLWRETHKPSEVLEAMLKPGILHYFGTHKPHTFNHRPERNRYRKAMIELGLTKYRFPGENLYRLIEGKIFDLKHNRLRATAKEKYRQI